MASNRPAIPNRPVVIAKVGNYAAPVDTSGMDADMKTLMTGQKGAAKKTTGPTAPLGWLKKMLGAL